MRKIITLLIFLAGFSLSYSQTLEERNKIKEYYESIRDKSVVFDSDKYSFTEKKDADRRAIAEGIPLTITDSRGIVGELVRFDENQPIYYSVYNEGLSITTRANLLYPGASMGLNLTGATMIAGVWDQNHPRLSHNDYKNAGGISRILAVDGPSPLGVSNHSTHVTGTILSSGVSATGISGRGIAYEADGWIFDWTNDMAEMDSAAGAGMLISNHSYGINASALSVWNFGAYVSDSNAVDNICFNNPKYIPIYAAGNDRDSFTLYNPSKGGNDLLNGDKTSKNAIVVGAVNNVSSYTGPSSVVVSSFSSYGPTDDFRIKPDIVAKGVNVFSTTSTSDSSYGFLSGTSMASPGVASSLLLVQQFVGFPYLNAATLKGLALHTADEAGSADGPDHKFGWGLLNTAKMVEVLQDENIESIVNEGALTNGVPYSVNVLALGTEPLRASISWTDRPGTAVSGNTDFSSPRLINDLDIVITKDGVTYSPWKLNKSWADLSAFKGDNDVDPFERVDILLPDAGVYNVQVSHKGTLVGGSQNYSLVITGIDADAPLSVDSFNQTDTKLWVANSELSFYSDTELTNVSIYDISGRLVLSTILNASEGSVDVSTFSKGIYNVILTQDNGYQVKKKIII